MLNGSEPFTIHHRNLRYIIYKAAVLVHSQIPKSENQTMLKNTTCVIYLNVNDITECCQFVPKYWENVQKYVFVVFQSEVAAFPMCP